MDGRARASPGVDLDRARARRWLGLILVLTFAVYAPSLGNHFALDDKLIAKAVIDEGWPNTMIQELRSLGDYFGSQYWEGHGRHVTVLYRPVTVLSYALTYRLFGGQSVAAEAFPHHFINVLLQLGAVWLVYLMIRKLGAGRGAGLCAALVFGLHAIHSEVVAGIVGRAELLGFCFGAGGLLLAVRARYRDGRGLLRAAAAALCFFLAFCSKENALAWAPFLLVFLLARSWTGRGTPLRRAAWTLGLPLIAVLGWYAGRSVMLACLGQEPDPIGYLANPIHAAPGSTRFLTAVMVQAYGLYQTILPFDLAGDYGPWALPLVETFSDPRFFGPALLLAAVVTAGLASARRQPLLFLALCCFFGFSFLTSNLLRPIGTLYAERLYYTPSLGLCFAVAALSGKLEASVRVRRVSLGLLAGWLLLCSLVILERNPVWKDTRSFYVMEAENQTRSASLQLNASEAYRQENNDTEWLRHLERAIEILPEYVEAWYNLGLYHVNRNEQEEAEAAFRKALGSTRFAETSATMRARVELNMAHTLLVQGRPTEARAHAERALEEDGETFLEHLDELMKLAVPRMDPRWLASLLALGERKAPGRHGWPFWRALLAERRRDLGSAEAELRRALGLAGPQGGRLEAMIRYHLARIMSGRGKRAAAIEQLETFLREHPGYPEAQKLLEDLKESR
ncbi:MAG: tetratricopeptide repeat protein [Planctomycetota bacterium]